ISGGRRDYAAPLLFGRERSEAVVCSANLEGAGLLEIFGLDEHLGADHHTEGFAADERRRRRDSGQAPAREFYVVGGYRHRGSGRTIAGAIVTCARERRVSADIRARYRAHRPRTRSRYILRWRSRGRKAD